MTKQELQKIFESSFDWDNWRKVMDFVFPEFQFSVQKIPIEDFTKAAEERIEGFYHHGSTSLSDHISLNLYEVELKESVNLPRNVKGIRKFIATEAIANTQASVAVFYSPDKSKWRFTLATKQLDDNFKESDRKPESYTYVFGDGERGRTAAERFYDLSKIENKKLKDLEVAFSVEALSKKFFTQYKEVYLEFVNNIKDNPSRLNLFKGDDREKLARDFVKKMMGRIVFLYFLQKKGWMGCKLKWQEGEGLFMKKLFEAAPMDSTFYMTFLESLFFDTLNAKRKASEEDCVINGVNFGKVPFLNGGLFEREDNHPFKLSLDWEIFNRFFEILNNYNFTIIEDDPDFKEIAVDPEMLGHIFENLLEDNKDKGAFYTPKEIVQYMCQESIIEYLNTQLSKYVKDKNLKEAIRKFVIDDIFSDLNAVDQNVDEYLFNALKDIKVCDPAIGSGAFPMGILLVIYRLIEHLNDHSPDVFEKTWSLKWDPARVKEGIIQNSIYGVDIEKGAVDIARLRFWLSIIIDEEEPKPLPNLDYKIMQGNSLLERFGPVDLKFDKKKYQKPIKKHTDLFGKVENPQISIAEAMAYKGFDLAKIEQEYFHTEDPEIKERIRKEITDFEKSFIDDEIKVKKDVIIDTINTLSKKLRDDNYNNLRTKQNDQKEQNQAENDLVELVAIDEESKKIKEGNKPYFLWNLYFMDVFDQGGFDVVIGNPPYLRVQEIARTQPENKLAYEENYKVAKAAYDLANLFFELAINIANKQSTNCFIFPHKFFNSSSTAVFRDYLLAGQYIDKIVHFGANMVFNDADTYTCIALFSPTKNSGFKLAKLKFDPTWRNEISRFKFHKVDYQDLKTASDLYGTNQWIFFDTDLGYKTLEILYKGSKKFENVFEDIFQGLATSSDKLYFVKKLNEDSKFYYVSSLIDESTFKVEKKYFKPILKGRDVQRYSVLSTDLLVFFPYNLDKDKYYNVPLDEFKEWCPFTYDYIMKYEKEFKARERGKAGKMKNWYNYIYPKNLTKFDQPKLSSMEICAKHPNVTLDNNHFYHPTTVYSWVKKEGVQESYEYFLAIANSKLMWWFLKNTGDTLQGDARRLKTNYLNPFPLPIVVEDAVHERFVRRVKAVLEAKRIGEDTKGLEGEIEVMVLKLYDLTFQLAKEVNADLALSEEEYNSFALKDMDV